MKLVRELEKRSINYAIEYRRTTDSCDGIVVRIGTVTEVWEVGFYDYDHIEAARFVLSGDVRSITAEAMLNKLDEL